LPAGFVCFFQGLALVGVRAPLRGGVGVFGCTAGWTAVGEARLVGPQLEFFRADSADSDGECHTNIMIQAVLPLQTMPLAGGGAV
jgi:hypothetical protein